MKNRKIILAIETANQLCSAAIFFDQNNFDERNILQKHIHSEKLIPMIDELLQSNKISANDLSYVAVSIGPGSFTGLRIGLTAAKGIAFASNLGIIPVPTFSSLALQISDYLINNTEFFVIINANVEECYLGKYSISEGKIIDLLEPKLVKKTELKNLIDNHTLVFGNLKNLKNIKYMSSPFASYVAKWAYLFGRDLVTYDYDFLEPKYLKEFKVKK